MSSSQPLIGILGAGQLGMMLATAGIPLGFRFRFLDPNPDSPARHLGDFVCADFSDHAALDRFAAGLDVATFEFENVPAESLDFLRPKVALFPSPRTLEVSQDRLHEKNMFRDLGIETPRFAPISSLQELETYAAEFGYPAVLKTRRLGYDGKGQFVLRSPADLAAAWKSLGTAPLILESFVPFQRELSILAVRSSSGTTALYPLVENRHHAGILRLSLPQSRDESTAITGTAREIAARIMTHLDYVGLLAIETFLVNGTLVANEIAPRVHNSGHWTIEGAVTSQFENHLRAITGLPLGDTAAREHSAMVNLIGSVPPLTELLAIEGAAVHLYHKAPREGRKVGHVTITATSRENLHRRLETIDALIPDMLLKK